MDSRIAIVGANGTGKSTLLNLMTGALMPIRGDVSRHPALKLAKYSQHSADQLPYSKSPLEYFETLYKQKFPEKDTQFWRQQLGRFGLTGAHQTSPISQLSDGLRNRVVFSQLSMEYPHILLLDEPTNHLGKSLSSSLFSQSYCLSGADRPFRPLTDMQSIEALGSAIKKFEGGVVVVSHDFRLLSLIAEELWEVKDRKIINLTKQGIDITQYKKKLADNSKAAIEKAQLLSKNTAKNTA